MSDHPSIFVDDNIQLISPKLDMDRALFDLIETNRSFLDQHITFAQNKTSVEKVNAFLREIINFNFGGQKFNMMIMHEDRIAGILGFHRILPIDARAEIGYWIGESFQGNGILTKSMPKFLQYGFDALAINRVELLTLSTHHRSISLANRTGFIQEGILKQYYFMHGAHHDAYIYSLLKSDFKSA